MLSTWQIIGCIGIVSMNLLAFSLMGIDKGRAKKGKWRIPEKTLFLAAALFGGLGGTLGMLFFRHKTKHWYFRLFFPLFMLLQAGLIAWILLDPPSFLVK
ncbi:MAG: DUF1294 domain-containing protein [Lachnospiraceae bacterium]|nr:DUF1294 domain-containing protein [Lachnospiraceae bacterium]